jgi:hypothetical protein
MTKYNVSPLVAREIEFSTGTTFGGSWCRYFISTTLHQCYIEATWKTCPNDLDGNKEIFQQLAVSELRNLPTTCAVSELSNQLNK